MSQIRANGINIEYEEKGERHHPSLVLVRGLGTQLIDWPTQFIETLVAAGFHTVCFDNRDVGLSQKFDQAGVPDLAAVLNGDEEPPYTLQDMADDVIGVMDTLNIDKAHVLGISMGGMIVQVLAATHGARLLSMISVMSTSSRPGLPPVNPEAMASLTAQPDPAGGDEAIDQLTAQGLEICGSEGTICAQEGFVVTAAGSEPQQVPPSDSRPTQVDRLLAAIDGSLDAGEIEQDLACAVDAVAIMEACYRSNETGKWEDVDRI